MGLILLYDREGRGLRDWSAATRCDGTVALPVATNPVTRMALPASAVKMTARCM